MVDFRFKASKSGYATALSTAVLMTLVLVAGWVAANKATADELQIGESKDFIPLMNGKPYLHVIHEGRSVKVQRVQDPNYELKGYFAKTARKCPPFCIQPITPSAGVQAIGEVELFDFMETRLRDGSGLLIDARTESWFRKGTIPGSVNYPFALFTKQPDDPDLAEVLKSLGAKPRGEIGAIEGLMEEWGLSEKGQKTNTWDFTDAKELVLWCNGPACGQSPRAIRGLVEIGYPPAKLKYYRGGMQMWQLWGLTTVVPRQ